MGTFNGFKGLIFGQWMEASRYEKIAPFFLILKTWGPTVQESMVTTKSFLSNPSGTPNHFGNRDSGASTKLASKQPAKAVVANTRNSCKHRVTRKNPNYIDYILLFRLAHW